MIVVEMLRWLLAGASFAYFITDLLKRYAWRIDYWQTINCSLHSPETWRIVMDGIEEEVRWEKWLYR